MTLQRAVDLLVYAPLGLALTARDELPRLIAKGRDGTTGQIGMARIVGRFAVDQGQKEASKLLRQAAGRLADLGLVPHPDRAPGPAGDPAPAAQPGAASGADRGGAPAAPSPAPTQRSARGGRAPAVDSLAIPGYDSLSAPQVVQRLDGLAEAELEAVRGYEAATRGRKTILSRVAQLQTAT